MNFCDFPFWSYKLVLLRQTKNRQTDRQTDSVQYVKRFIWQGTMRSRKKTRVIIYVAGSSGERAA